MKIEEGKFYKTRDGRKVGPMGQTEWSGGKELISGPDSFGSRRLWWIDGRGNAGRDTPEDLIAEWTEGPVRTVTRREVVAGSYGRLKTLKVSPSGVSYTKAVVSLEERFYSREDLTEIIDLLAEVRDGLELAGALPDGE